MNETKKSIYDELSALLTDYEGMNIDVDRPKVTIEDFYHMLVKIQNRWEDTITAVDK